MDPLFELAGPERTLRILGVRMLGVNAVTGKKLLLTLVFALGVWLLGRVLRAVLRAALGRRDDVRARFWTRQGVHLFTTLLFVLCVVSIWLDDPGRVGTVAGVVTAGLAVALQRVITAVAGYFVILRGKTFNVGDRIAMGGVRGDVVSLSFVHTTIIEMGQPPPVQGADPAMWVESRQYSGRMVTVTNDKVFEEPVFNYTRAFPFIWEEMHVPVKYGTDLHAIEQVLLDAARAETQDIADEGRAALQRMEHHEFMRPADVDPKVYLRLTDNWMEMTVRFCTHEFGVRDVKDRMSRRIIAAMQEAGIEVASGTFGIVELPPLRIERTPRRPSSSPSTLPPG